MAKGKKNKGTKKPRAEKYEEKTIIDASFKQLMQAAVKDANAKTEPKK